MQVGYRSFGFLRRTFRLYTLTTQNNLTPPLFQIVSLNLETDNFLFRFYLSVREKE